MVNAEKHKTATAESDAEKHKTATAESDAESPKTVKYNDAEFEVKELSKDELIKRLAWFYSCDTLTDDIIEYCESNFEKPLDAIDVMNVAIFTLHGIVKAETDSDKEHILEMISGMVNDKYHLNEWIYKMSAVIKANDKTLCDCIVNDRTDDIDAEIDKAIKQAEYKAWNTELSVIKRKRSAKDRIADIKGGA